MMKIKTKDIYNSNQESLQPLAFVLPPDAPDDDLTAPPMDGEQFLRRAIAEARRCQGVVVVECKNKPQTINQLPDMPEIKVCSSELLPSKDWQTSAMADFSRLRLDMDSLRGKKEKDETLIALKNQLPPISNEEEWLSFVQQKVPCSSGPTTRLCLALSQSDLWSLLGLLQDWLIDGDISVPVGCRWIYCLLACLDHPIPPDVYSTLRSIARTLINYRAQLESLESEELPHVNLLVCIIARYFNQTDLADPYLSM